MREILINHNPIITTFEAKSYNTRDHVLINRAIRFSELTIAKCDTSVAVLQGLVFKGCAYIRFRDVQGWKSNTYFSIMSSTNDHLAYFRFPWVNCVTKGRKISSYN
ncbi:hypothetical protein PIROE2DRAFT_1775 [Piromyces sp. E2]|nr:hypothetical protein PIROE2DRAFT_1775 [Piromyces sp. E2]|eukprot:OUM70097.1 hypothetical protein PIROE2DRAFT_1775 [Piromyces sp. E2]